MHHKLEFLLALAKERHFGRAAEVCGVSQPNLSLSIKQLEADFGVPLVNRSARFIGFTPEGERVLDWARRIVGDTRSMRAEIEVMKRGLKGRLKIAVIPTALPVVSRLTTDFWTRHPDVELTITSQSSAGILSMLENLEVDVGVTYLDGEPLGTMTELPLYRERCHLITAEGETFSDRATVTWEEAATLPLCLLTPSMQHRRIIDRVFAEVGCTATPQLETNSIVVIAAHVRARRWATILPRLMADELDLPDYVKKIPIVAPEVASLVGLVIERRDPQPPLTAAFLAEARAIAPQLGAEA